MFSSNTSAVSGDANYIEDVFSTYLYTGNGSTQTITNGIDLATKGGMTWFKSRSNAFNNWLFDTTRGAGKGLISNNTLAEITASDSVTSFNVDGFSLGADSNNGVNRSTSTYASWTFRKQPKFFDVLTWSGDGTGNRAISHTLASTPGCIMVKVTNTTGDWYVYHTSTGINKYLYLNGTSAQQNGNLVTAVSSTTFTVESFWNASGETYVAYLFAHNAGGFGLTGTDNVISCGSFTTDGSGNATIDLGYEPQWVLMKSSSSSSSNWILADTMRGWTVDGAGGNANRQLYANTSDAEAGGTPANLNSTGFTFKSSYSGYFSTTFIYIAIRRGTMKVPTSGTSVFIPVSATPSGATTVTTNFPVDLAINAQRDAGTSGNKVFWDRLRGSSTAAGQGLFSNLTNAEVSYSGNGIGLQSNTTIVDNFWNTLNGATTPVIYWNFKRAPSFFDEVCFTQSDYTQAYTHNLTVVPEMMIVKRRNNTSDWSVYSAALGNTKYLKLQDTGGEFTGGVWGNTSPTLTQFTFSGAGSPNTYVAYLFATCAGVSKVGSYTGTGTTLQINCGFTGGARFVLIKRTDSTGDWYVWDSARGIVAGNDPYLLLNSTAAEVTNTDYVDTYSAGFEISSTAPAAINANGGTFIFLAIA